MASFKIFSHDCQFLYNELKERQKECKGVEGHIIADPSTNFCYYCYQHLDYTELELYKPLKKEINLEREIKIQKSIDLFDGLLSLEYELFGFFE